MNSLKIVFMGTPEFAVPSLEILVRNNYHIAGVITAPDRPQGRGRHLSFSPVKQYALAQKLKLFQPVNLKDPLFIEELRSLNANLQIVVAFRMLPEIVWNMPLYGTYNLHASLLPDYRGAAPINWALINGEKITGLTTFKIQREIDTGAILLQIPEPINEEDDAGSLHDRLKMKGAGLIFDTVRLIESGNVDLKIQPMYPGPSDIPKFENHIHFQDFLKMI